MKKLLSTTLPQKGAARALPYSLEHLSGSWTTCMNPSFSYNGFIFDCGAPNDEVPDRATVFAGPLRRDRPLCDDHATHFHTNDLDRAACPATIEILRSRWPPVGKRWCGTAARSNRTSVQPPKESRDGAAMDGRRLKMQRTSFRREPIDCHYQRTPLRTSFVDAFGRVFEKTSVRYVRCTDIGEAFSIVAVARMLQTISLGPPDKMLATTSWDRHCSGHYTARR